MKTSRNGRRFIELWEDLWLKAKDDGFGTLTVGYGHTTAAGPPRVYQGMVITKADADRILAADLASVEAAVDHLVKVSLTQNQFDAIVSFTFNEGDGALRKSTLLKDINARRFDRVPADLAKWNRAGGRVVRGLTRRRAAESKLFRTGVVQGP